MSWLDDLESGDPAYNKYMSEQKHDRRRVVDESTVIQDETDAKNYMTDVLGRDAAWGFPERYQGLTVSEIEELLAGDEK